MEEKNSEKEVIENESKQDETRPECLSSAKTASCWRLSVFLRPVPQSLLCGAYRPLQVRIAVLKHSYCQAPAVQRVHDPFHRREE